MVVFLFVFCYWFLILWLSSKCAHAMNLLKLRLVLQTIINILCSKRMYILQLVNTVFYTYFFH